MEHSLLFLPTGHLPAHGNSMKYDGGYVVTFGAEELGLIRSYDDVDTPTKDGYDRIFGM